MRICVGTESSLTGHMIQTYKKQIDAMRANFVPANFYVPDCSFVSAQWRKIREMEKAFSGHS